jgi:molybdopterin-containing oxidoreductase family iron-sulfur binding subunit
MVTQQDSPYKWGMVVDVDRCTGCQACVLACQVENNIPLNTENLYKQQRIFAWIRIERYWEGEFPNVKARFIPILCQQCGNAPCEPVCPVFATYHNNEGMNVQVYNRCVGTRYCANGCPYHVRFFNYWEPVWPESLRNQLNPDVTVRSRGVMEKCSFCVQRIRRAERKARGEDRLVLDGEIQTACSQACPTDALVFGNLKDEDSRVSTMSHDTRHYKLLDEKLGTDPSVVYLARVEEKEGAAAHG